MDFGRFLRKRALIDLARQLVRIPTENPPGNEKELVFFLKPLLSKMGFRVKTHLSPKGRWNIITERRWTKGGRRLIFNGHLDVVPGGCMIEADRRMLPGEKKEEVLRNIKEVLDSIQAKDPFFRYRLEEIDFAEPSEINPDEEIVKISAKAIQEVMGQAPKVKGTSGFTDGRYYINQCHIPSLILGPGAARQSHTTDEFVEVDALAQAAQIYALIVTHYLEW